MKIGQRRGGRGERGERGVWARRQRGGVDKDGGEGEEEIKGMDWTWREGAERRDKLKKEHY